MQDEEIWLPIQDYPRYEVSNYGRVQNIRTGRMMKLTQHFEFDWTLVGLTFDRGRQRTVRVATLVAEAFMSEPFEPNTTLLHLDGNRANNRVDNLMWKPRWFVVKYFRQMQMAPYRMSAPFESEKTGDVFDSIAQFCEAYGGRTLPEAVLDALMESRKDTPATTTSFGHFGTLRYL